MSRLTDKYQSYTHFKGMSFDESTFTTTPAESGTKIFHGDPVVIGAYTSDGANNPTISTGVMPNQKCYEMEFDSASPAKHVRLIYGNTTVGTGGGSSDIRRLIWDDDTLDRVIGFWLKMPSSFPVNNASLALHRWLRGTAALINIGPGKSNNLPSIGFIHTQELASPSINFYTSYTDQNSNVINIEWDKWYFVAVRKTMTYDNPALPVDTAQTGTIQFQHYINGELVNTVSATSWTKRGCNGIVWGNNAAPAGGQFKTAMSSWFVADWSDVGQTALRDIYDYGAPIQTPIKYWDGDSWENSTGSKVYYDGAWRDIYASRWDGTQWLPL
jgi:hypothetical protein